MIDGKLSAWQRAGLLDAQTVAAIRAYEAENARPLVLWAAIGLGALAVGLGLVSVVAANWEDIPGRLRLAVHFLALAGLAALLWRLGRDLAGEASWAEEAALFVFGVLGLTFFGHVGQVYQTSAPLWQPLAAWLVLFAPAIALRGSGWLTAGLVALVVTWASWGFADPARPLFGAEARSDAVIGLATALPVLLAPLGAWMDRLGAREGFWSRLEQLGFAYAIACASLVIVASAFGELDGDGLLTFTAQGVQALVGLVAAALVGLARRDPPGASSAAVLAGSALAILAAHAVEGSQLGAALLFMALWVGIALAALQGGSRGVFQLAVATVAARLVILSFELASDLLTSGFGLILAGVLILAIAWGAVRLSRRLAPARRGAA